MDLELLKQTKSQKLGIWSVSKETLALEWIDKESRLKQRYLNQGDVYLCELGENIGHEEAKERPVLILSDSRYNTSGLVTIAPLTSTIKLVENVKDRKSPKIKTHYVLRKEKYHFLKNDSTVLVENVRTISVIRLNSYKGQIEEGDIAAIKNRLKTLFGI
ncbi:type II toxin-antitoxin system PemK/MazF family toxin [Enterococcus malodoratus]|uniref:type II toxin-antitoxin system PemK/MazF family toxin n=1 Tax=Enterococcus malodoratus TaxID=71451 RepID=UPI002073E870|nr:type II toxin-antitoxin system PemK/MazF family toxin [Enterococcus malodoratus]